MKKTPTPAHSQNGGQVVFSGRPAIFGSWGMAGL